MAARKEKSTEGMHQEVVEISGHIIDSLILPKILDCITAAGGHFRIEEISVGQQRSDPSFARVNVAARDAEQLQRILEVISDHGAVSVSTGDCRIVAADIAGAFPDDFYSTTNQRTEIRVNGHWLSVEDQEMDCGIAVDVSLQTARCVPMSDVVVGQQFIVGHRGVRVFPEERTSHAQSFEFMNSAVSTEKPKGVAIRAIARRLFENRQANQNTLVVGGPAIVHTGSVPHLSYLIDNGFVNKLFAGNALATHDIEHALYGTSLGVQLESGDLVEAGHEHHLRAINSIRRAGGIARAAATGLLKSGIMYDCVTRDVEFILAGSIRDDGPLPEVITDALEAQRRMRDAIRDVSFCLMIATTLHSVAVGNLLPASVDVVCVDINPSTVIKLSDRGSFQTVGVVTDVEPFLRALVEELKSIAEQADA